MVKETVNLKFLHSITLKYKCNHSRDSQNMKYKRSQGLIFFHFWLAKNY